MKSFFGSLFKATLTAAFFFAVGFLFMSVAHADAPSAIPSSIPGIDAATQAVALSAGIKATVAAVLAFAFDMLMRVLKTNKPLSIAWLMVGTLKAATSILLQVVRFMQAVASTLDGILPQASVTDPAPVVASVDQAKAVAAAAAK